MSYKKNTKDYSNNNTNDTKKQRPSIKYVQKDFSPSTSGAAEPKASQKTSNPSDPPSKPRKPKTAKNHFKSSNPFE